MAKNKVSDWDAVAINNTDLTGTITLGEGMPPSYVNDAIREMMAQIKQWQSGVSGDSITIGGDCTVVGKLNVTGGMQLDGSNGDSGQVLTSKGSDETPIWQSLPVFGSMANQDSDNVNITGGTITGITKLETAGGGLDVEGIKTNDLRIGDNWTIYQSGSYLYFKFGGNNVLRIASDGHLASENNITAFQPI